MAVQGRSDVDVWAIFITSSGTNIIRLQLCRLGGKPSAGGTIDEKKGDMSNYRIALLALKEALGALGRVGWKK
jgi:hypothetical protein